MISSSESFSNSSGRATWSWYLTETAPGNIFIKINKSSCHHLTFKGHARLEHQRWSSNKPETKSLIDDSRLTPAFLSVVVEIFCYIGLSSDLNTLMIIKLIISLIMKFFVNYLNASHEVFHLSHLKIEWSRILSVGIVGSSLCQEDNYFCKLSIYCCFITDLRLCKSSSGTKVWLAEMWYSHRDPSNHIWGGKRNNFEEK